MEKITIYEALKTDGAKLKPSNFYSQEQLKDMYVERFGEEPQTKEPESEIQQEQLKEIEIRTLFFSNGGWCKELERSFSQGYYRPASVNEYKILKKYASREV